MGISLKDLYDLKRDDKVYAGRSRHTTANINSYGRQQKRRQRPTSKSLTKAKGTSSAAQGTGSSYEGQGQTQGKVITQRPTCATKEDEPKKA